jgi:hypothetical protein
MTIDVSGVGFPWVGLGQGFPEVPALWEAPETTAQDRQEVVRHLVERVEVAVQDKSEIASASPWTPRSPTPSAPPTPSASSAVEDGSAHWLAELVTDL